MTSGSLSTDKATLADLEPWLRKAAKRFWSSGYGPNATALGVDEVLSIASSPACTLAASILCPDGRRGLALVVQSPWESTVLSRPVTKLAWMGADDFDIARQLTHLAAEAARRDGVVLISAAPGHSPLYIHAALSDAGFHVGSQVLTLRGDLDQMTGALERIPMRQGLRAATPDDADAVAAIARTGFEYQRFTADPCFPRAWGQELMAAWARNLVLGAADTVMVAESGGRIVGFVSMTWDLQRRAAVPPLHAIDQHFNGWGVGAMLIRVMLEWYRDRGRTILFAATEKNNVVLNSLYLRLGASIIDCNLVYQASPGLEKTPAV